jgi:predicted nucleotidyltransferase
MNIAQPIRSVIPSLAGPVLEALAGTSQPLTLTRAHALAGSGSLAGVRKVLLHLVESGLVLAVPGGYMLNRDHVAAEAVAMLAALHGELARRLRGAAEDWGGDYRLLGLFGSAARRDGDESSDIDVLLVSDDDGAPDFGDELASRIERWTGNPGHVFTVTTEALRHMQRAGSPVIDSWERELVVLAGENLLLHLRV